MTRRVKFLAIVPDCETKKTKYYAYFFCSKTNQLISIRTSIRIVDFIIKKGIRKDGSFKDYNDCIAEGLDVRKVIIKKGSNEGYITVIKVKRGHRNKDFLTPFSSGFVVSQVLGIPLEMEKKTLNSEGVYVTRELLEASIEKNY